MSILKQVDVGVPMKEICRAAKYYQWKSKCGGLDASELKQIKELKAESAKLKRMYAELALEMRR